MTNYPYNHNISFPLTQSRFRKITIFLKENDKDYNIHLRTTYLEYRKNNTMCDTFFYYLTPNKNKINYILSIYNTINICNENHVRNRSAQRIDYADLLRK